MEADEVGDSCMRSSPSSAPAEGAAGTPDRPEIERIATTPDRRIEVEVTALAR
ncbi:hypothetical protein OHS81_09480 [Streptomyces sp. NBC_00400]|uniref:hypothetical protein n=1 Tax=Streptomyces sp. NBC_00400 TaxID=2975737 RepID=UPI002E1C9003